MIPRFWPWLWATLVVWTSLSASIFGAPLTVEPSGINISASEQPSSVSPLEAITTVSSEPAEVLNASSSAPESTSSISEIGAFNLSAVANATESAISLTESTAAGEIGISNATAGAVSTELLNAISSTVAETGSSISASNISEGVASISTFASISETTESIVLVNETVPASSTTVSNVSDISTESSTSFDTTTASAIENANSTGLATGVVELNATSAISNVPVEVTTSVMENGTSGAGGSTEAITAVPDLNATESTLFTTIGSLISTVLSTIGNVTLMDLGNVTLESTISTAFAESSLAVENATLETTASNGTIEINGTTAAASTELATGAGEVDGTATTPISTIGNELQNSTTGFFTSAVPVETTAAENATIETAAPIELVNSTLGFSSETSTIIGTNETASPIETTLATTRMVSESTPQFLNLSESTTERTASEMVNTSVLFSVSTSQPSAVNIPSGQQVNVSTFDCGDRDAGLYGNPNVVCDTKFYICVDSTVLAYEQPCPAHLFFDDELKICESWVHIPACSGKSRPTPLPTLAPRNETFSTVAPVVNCVNKTDGNYPDPLGTIKPSCSNRFYVCIGERTFEYRCPFNLIYDGETDKCERQDRVFACTGVHFNETEAINPPPATLPPVNFDCSGRSDGYFTVNCSNSFFSCNGGQARELQCPHGLVFDVESQACDIPSNTFTCTGTKRTTKLATTTEVANISTTPSPMDCSNALDGIYPDPTSKCSRHFYFCAHNESFHGVCPANLFYDAEAKKCELWLNVFDCSGLRPTSAPKTTRSPPPVFPAVDFDCSRLEDGNYANPKSKCSKFYYVCANMEAFQQDCASDLYYDPDRNLCDSWMHVFVCSGQTIPPSTPAANFTLSSTEKPAFDCSAKVDGTYENPVNACSHIYYQCVSGITYDFECPANLYFYIKRDQCDTFDNVFACSGIAPTPSRPSSTTSRPIPTEPPIECMFLADGDYRDPAKNCSNVYYSCAAGFAFKRICPHGTFFDDAKDQCDRFSNIFACSGKQGKTTPTGPSTKQTPRPVYPFDCTKRYDGNYPAGDCLQDFWSCVGGLTFPRHCLYGLVYDAEFDDCEFPFLVPKCGGNRVTSTSKPLSSSKRPVVFDCSFLADGNYLNPQAKDNCSNVFYTCANGMSSRLQCPGGLYYDHVMDSCDHRENVPACLGKTAVVSTPTSAPVSVLVTAKVTQSEVVGTASTSAAEELNATSETTTASGAVTGASNETTLALSTESQSLSLGNESSTASATSALVSETQSPLNETTTSGMEMTTEPIGAAINMSSIVQTTVVFPINESMLENATGLPQLIENATSVVNGSETTIVGESANVSQPLETTMVLLNASTELSSPESILNASSATTAGTEEVNATSELTTVNNFNATEIVSSSSASSSLTENVTSEVETTTVVGLATSSELIRNVTEALNASVETSAPFTGIMTTSLAFGNASSEALISETAVGVLNTTEPSSLVSESATATGSVNATEMAVSQGTTEPAAVGNESSTVNETVATGAPVVNATGESMLTNSLESSPALNATMVASSSSAASENVTAVFEISSSELSGNASTESISALMSNLTTEASDTASPSVPITAL